DGKGLVFATMPGMPDIVPDDSAYRCRDRVGESALCDRPLRSVLVGYALLVSLFAFGPSSLRLDETSGRLVCVSRISAYTRPSTDIHTRVLRRAASSSPLRSSQTRTSLPKVRRSRPSYPPSPVRR